MITVNEIETLDLGFIKLFSEPVRAIWESAGNLPLRVLKKTEKLWLLSENETPVLLAGIAHETLIGRVPELWAVPFASLKVRHVRHMHFLRETLFELYGKNLEATVEHGKVADEKFAKFFGFRLYERGEIFDTYRMN